MAAAVGGIIDETGNAVPLNGFFLENILFLLFAFSLFPKVQLFLCIYLFLYLSIYMFYLTIFQR